MRILLTGATGQVGWELQRTLMPLGEVIAPPRADLDLANPDSMINLIRELRPDGIINPGAYTAVDQAESEPDRAQQINGVAPGILAEEAQKLGAWLIHYSTDYVFDGANQLPYQETAPTNPLGVYGRSKRSGEMAIEAIGGKYLIFRTAWVYSLRGKNFLKTMLRLAHERQELKIVNDQLGSPTWSRLIGEVTAQVISGQRHQEAQGIFHLTSFGTTTWYEFTKMILNLDPDRDSQTIERVLPITTAEYPTPAKRPQYSVLDCQKIQATFDIDLPHWEQVLRLVLT